MIWLFWSLVGLVVIGLPVLAILARRNRSPLRPAGPTTTRVLRTMGRSFWEVFCTLSHPFGLGGWHRRSTDASMDHIRQKEAQRRGRRNPSDPE